MDVINMKPVLLKEILAKLTEDELDDLDHFDPENDKHLVKQALNLFRIVYPEDVPEELVRINHFVSLGKASKVVSYAKELVKNKALNQMKNG